MADLVKIRGRNQGTSGTKGYQKDPIGEDRTRTQLNLSRRTCRERLQCDHVDSILEGRTGDERRADEWDDVFFYKKQ